MLVLFVWEHVPRGDGQEVLPICGVMICAMSQLTLKKGQSSRQKECGVFLRDFVCDITWIWYIYLIVYSAKYQSELREVSCEGR